MQVLNAPSREELDSVHARGSWLGIGVPSVRNTFKVSRFKTVCWTILLLTTTPIHLLFNSTVFTTDHVASDFHLTIGTEDLVYNDGPYYPPGAALTPAGLYNPKYMRPETGGRGYGMPVAEADYRNNHSEAIRNISTAVENSGDWDRLDENECREEYITCHGLKAHRSVVLIVDQPRGWLFDEMSVILSQFPLLLLSDLGV